MNPSKGYYSIVQYCPDLARGETANIGVVLLVPDRSFLRAKLVSDNTRVRHVFNISGSELRQLRAFKKSFISRIEAESTRITSLETLQKFVDTRGNFIQLTSPRFVKVHNCEETLASLFTDLVGGESKKKPRVSLEKQIDARFKESGVEPYLRHDIHVIVPHANQELRVPFGFQNGRFNLLQVVPFDSGDENTHFRKACVQSMQGRFLQESGDDELGDLRFNVIGKFPSDRHESISIVRKTLQESDVRLFVESDLSELIDEIRRTAKPLK